MDQSSCLNYKQIFDRKVKVLRQAEEQRRPAEEKAQAEERTRQLTRNTSVLEYLQACHNLFSRPLHVGTVPHPTKQKIPTPEGGSFAPIAFFHGRTVRLRKGKYTIQSAATSKQRPTVRLSYSRLCCI